MNDFGFPRKLRIRRQADFDRVYRRQLHAADEVLVVTACENGLEFPRLGLSVSKKVGNAVLRNRWKRLIREAFRLHRATFGIAADLVVRPRRGADPDFHAIARSLPRLVRRIAKKLEKSA